MQVVKKKFVAGELVANPLFVGWVKDYSCGWLAACSSDSMDECHKLLRGAYIRSEVTVLPMGDRPYEESVQAN